MKFHFASLVHLALVSQIRQFSDEAMDRKPDCGPLARLEALAQSLAKPSGTFTTTGPKPTSREELRRLLIQTITQVLEITSTVLEDVSDDPSETKGNDPSDPSSST